MPIRMTALRAEGWTHHVQGASWKSTWPSLSVSPAQTAMIVLGRIGPDLARLARGPLLAPLQPALGVKESALVPDGPAEIGYRLAAGGARRSLRNGTTTPGRDPWLAAATA